MSLTIGQFGGPILITVAYLTLYYALMMRVLGVKQRLAREHAARGERFDRYFGGDRELLSADRAVLNVLEHMPPFLVLLWLHAIFVGAASATIAGGAYLVARAAHPFLLGRTLGGTIRKRVMLATMPAYAVLAYFAVSLVVATLEGA